MGFLISNPKTEVIGTGTFKIKSATNNTNTAVPGMRSTDTVMVTQKTISDTSGVQFWVSAINDGNFTVTQEYLSVIGVEFYYVVLRKV